ncbi:MAG: hypothetical protein E7319_01145 [Clostridiales bacterium]|nr:hypothetical protein [Clostridiales bacterium]
MKIWTLLGWVGLLLFFSKETMEAALQAADLFVGGVMPALFPVMVLGGLVRLRAGNGKPSPATGIFYIMFGFAAGSPASAKQLSASVEAGLFPVRWLMSLACACGVMSPMFFIGTLASRVGQAAAWRMLLVHWATAIITGLLCYAFDRVCSPNKEPACEDRRATGTELPTPVSLPLAISAAAQALLSVLGAMMLFAMAAALLKAAAFRLFPGWAGQHSLLLSVLWATLEIGGGSFAVLDACSAAPCALLCGLCSMGGLSIWLQNLLFLGKWMHPAKLLGWRMLHGVLAWFVYWMLEKGAAVDCVSAAVVRGPLPACANTLPLLLLILLALYPLLRRKASA